MLEEPGCKFPTVENTRGSPSSIAASDVAFSIQSLIQCKFFTREGEIGVGGVAF